MAIQDPVETTRTLFQTFMKTDIDGFQVMMIAFTLAVFAAWVIIALFKQKADGERIGGVSMRTFVGILIVFFTAFFAISAIVI